MMEELFKKMLQLWKDKYSIDQVVIEHDAKVLFNAIMEEIIDRSSNQEEIRNHRSLVFLCKIFFFFLFFLFYFEQETNE